MAHPFHEPLDVTMQVCIENCSDCHNACTETLAYCMAVGEKHAEPPHLKALLDCAQTCAASADFMLRDSGLYPQMCGLCAEACERCAESCEQFAGDRQMQACAGICRRCAETCREMAGMK